MNRDAQAILADFGQKIGIENIAFDEDGNCQLGVDEFVFTIEHPDDVIVKVTTSGKAPSCCTSVSATH